MASVSLMEGDGRRHAPIVALFAIAMFISYVDRGSLSTVAPTLSADLDISNSTLGLLLSAFFWLYAPAQLLGGWCAQRFTVRHVLAFGVALWSLATFFTGLAQGLAMLFALRLLLGLGESVIFPCISRFLAEMIGDHERGGANAMVSLGISLGPMVGTFVGGMVLAAFGWRWVFLGFGLVSMLWLIPWLLVRMPAPPERDRPLGIGPGYRAIVRKRAAWGAGLGHFCNNYSHYLMLTWLPTFLVKGMGFPISTMAVIGSLVFAVQAVGVLTSGLLSDAMVRHGVGNSAARKLAILTGCGCCGLAMLGIGLSSGWLVIALLLIGNLGLGMVSPMLYVIGQTLAGPTAGGRWMGWQNFVGNLAGIISPIATGFIVDATGSYVWVFFTAAAVAAAGMLCWGLVVEKVEPVDWS